MRAAWHHHASELTTRLLERFSAELMETGGKRGELSRNTVWSYVKAVRGAGVPFSWPAFEEFLRDKPMQPAGGAALALA